MHVAGIHPSHFMKVGADDFEQILDRSVVAETASEVVKLLPVGGVFIKAIEHRATGNPFVEPFQISADAQIAPGAPQDCSIVRCIPRSHGLSRHIVGGMMFMHSGPQPHLDKIAQRNRIEQCKRQRGERCIPRKA